MLDVAARTVFNERLNYTMERGERALDFSCQDFEGCVPLALRI